MAADNPNIPATPPPPVMVRTVFRPFEETQVPADEAAALKRDGLLAEGAPPEPPKPPELVTVRTTFRPHDPIEVSGDEAEALRHQGLLVEDPPEPEPAAKTKTSAKEA